LNGQITAQFSISMILDCTEKRGPETPWLLVCLSTLHHEHRYFDRDYSPDPEPTTDVIERFNWMTHNDQLPDFLQGLPIRLAVARRNLVPSQHF